MKRVALIVIRIYQKTLSLDHGWPSHFSSSGACRFTPTCSEYTYQAIDKYGLIKGMLKGTRRIFRCHPFSQGGYDPP